MLKHSWGCNSDDAVDTDDESTTMTMIITTTVMTTVATDDRWLGNHRWGLASDSERPGAGIRVQSAAVKSLSPPKLQKQHESIGFGATDVSKPYEFRGCGAMDVTKPYEFIWLFGGKWGSAITFITHMVDGLN